MHKNDKPFKNKKILIIIYKVSYSSGVIDSYVSSQIITSVFLFTHSVHQGQNATQDHFK